MSLWMALLPPVVPRSGVVSPAGSQPRDETTTTCLIAAESPVQSTKNLASTESSDSPNRGGCAAGFVLPIEGGAISSVFRPPAFPWSSGHRGVDLELGDSRILVAPADGTISFAGGVGGKSVVSIDHGGFVSSLEPASGAPAVGTTVRAGERVAIAEGGSDHCARRCVHWGVRTAAGEYLDPLEFVGSGVMLKPLEG